MPSSTPVLVWFRNDLRLSDNPALDAAVKTGAPVIPVYIHDDKTAGDWAPGGASKWWLHGSLEALGKALADLGSRLVLRAGQAETVIRKLTEETGARQVFVNAASEPWLRTIDDSLAEDLGEGYAVMVGATLRALGSVQTDNGTPYKVYTPFWRAFVKQGPVPRPTPAPERLMAPDSWPGSDQLDDWSLRPTSPDWAQGFADFGTPGEASAQERLDGFSEDAVTDYGDMRDRPGVDGTSRLSAHLHFGEISPRQVWHGVLAAQAAKGDPTDEAVSPYLRQIVWREFAQNLLWAMPDLPDQPMRREFADFPWDEGDDHFQAWCRGETGYPIVDAGMRQLWHSGWMHNRVRMITASFLIKDLLVPWQKGEAWFWDTLVDANLANNAMGWQWVAGCGPDAAPYFRIFNPVTQGEKFDPDGTYIRHWVSELADLPDKYLHKPWEAPQSVLDKAGVTLGDSYPKPLVDHKAARKRALAAFDEIKN